MNAKKTDTAVAIILMVLCLVLYLVTLARGAVPGPSSNLVLNALGLFPNLIPAALLWHAIARFLAAVSGGQAILVLNAFSALCAAISVGLLYAVMRHSVFACLDPYAVREDRAGFVSVLAGGVSAAALGLSAPFWSVATRAHMMSFDIMLLLLAAWLLISFMRTGSLRYAIILTLIYGLLAAQFSTMIVMGPLFGVGILYGLWRHDKLLPRHLGLLAVLGVVGILVGYGLLTFFFYRSPGYVFRDYRGFWHLLWSIWVYQAMQIMHSLPREGWLIILFTTTVPWLTMLTMARRGLNDDRDIAIVFLHLIMTLFAMGVWLHAPLTPWRLMGAQRVLITPYVLVAMVTGYLAAFWFLLAGAWHDVRDQGILALAFFGFGKVLSLAMVVFAVVLPWWFADEAQPRGVSAVRDVAGDVVDSMEGRTWLVSDGGLDAHYFIAAWERGIPLQILSLPSGNQLIYQRYISSLLDDVRLQNAVRLSMPALLSEWFRDAERAAQVAILSEPDYWRRAGYAAVPQRMVYVGVEPEALDITEGEGEAVVAFLRKAAERYATTSDDAAKLRVMLWAATHAGRLGNDFAVLLEDQGHDAAARSVYDAVLHIDPDNISSLLNLYAMVASGRIADAEGRIAARLQAFEEGLSERLRIWSLVRTYGIVRAPEAFAEMGWGWAYSGQARVAVEDVERAAALAGDVRSPALEALMAEVYLLDDRPSESALIYRRLMEDPAERLRGMAGLYRLALRDRQIAVARDLLARMLEEGMPAERVVLEESLLDILDGAAEVALARLDDFLIDHRDSLRGWVLMAEAGMIVQNERALNRALRRIEMLEGGGGYYASTLRARIAFANNNFIQALDYYNMALNRRPGYKPLVEELLRLNLFLQRRDAAQRHMRTLLHVDPSHALALYVRGSLQIADGDYRLAEDSLRRSLESERLPLALNDLAWLLLQREAYAEAEEMVREALDINAEQAMAWSTLGNILMRTERLDEAEAAFSRALALDASRPITHLHQAELQIMRGRPAAAREILDQFAPYRDRMSADDLSLWRRLDEQIR